MKKWILVSIFMLFAFRLDAMSNGIKIKDISRIEGVRDNALVGYGLVVGLAGSGDSQQNKATLQSLRNTLENFGVAISRDEIRGRNVAAVIVSAELPAFSQPGDRIDVHVSSIGDARSLQGGTLFLTPLQGADDNIYALAQGILTVGGFKFESNQSVLQKNHPTVGFIAQGAVVEREISGQFSSQASELNLILSQPDFLTADKIAMTVEGMRDLTVDVVNPGKVKITSARDESIIRTIAKIQHAYIEAPDVSRVVINEKTGTIVAGADIRISDVVISHGSLKLTIETQFNVSQPNNFIGRASSGIETVVVPETTMSVNENNEAVYRQAGGTNITDLVQALQNLKLSTRDIISILQALKQSGALHAELVVQ